MYLDTATEACSAAVWRDGVVHSRFELAPRAHTQLLLPMARSVMQAAGVSFEHIDGVAFDRGPGSFTGVRIAVSAALGMAMGLGCPVLGLSSLAVLAQSQCDDMAEGEVIHAALDARMGEVYHAAFMRRAGRLIPIADEQVICPDALIAQWLAEKSDARIERAIGSGFARYGELAVARDWNAIAADQFPDARFGVALAAAASADAWRPPTEVAPVYLRDEVATPKAG